MRKILKITAAILAALTLCSCSLLYYDESSDSEEESSIGGYIVPAEFTEDELEIQAVLEEAADSITYMFAASENALNGYHEYKVIFEQPGDKDGIHAEKTYRMDLSGYPNTLAGFRNELGYYLTSEAVEMFSESFAVGKEIDNYWLNSDPNNDTLAVTVTEGSVLDESGSLTAFPHLIMLETFALYRADFSEAAEALNSSFWTTAHITEKTDDTIKFAYIVENDGILTEQTGILKNEDGWKLSWYMDWLK